MTGCKSVDTPLMVNEKLMKEDGAKKVDETLYRSLIGKLYLTARHHVCTQLIVKIHDNPSQIHFGAAKRVLRYLQGTLNYGIWYERTNKVKLIGYCDSDWGGCIDDMKSTSGYAFSLGNGIFFGHLRSNSVLS